MKLETTMACGQVMIDPYGTAYVRLESHRGSEYERTVDEELVISCLPQSARKMLGRTFRVTVEAIGDDA